MDGIEIDYVEEDNPATYYEMSTAAYPYSQSEHSLNYSSQSDHAYAAGPSRKDAIPNDEDIARMIEINEGPRSLGSSPYSPPEEPTKNATPQFKHFVALTESTIHPSLKAKIRKQRELETSKPGPPNGHYSESDEDLTTDDSRVRQNHDCACGRPVKERRKELNELQEHIKQLRKDTKEVQRENDEAHKNYRKTVRNLKQMMALKEELDHEIKSLQSRLDAKDMLPAHRGRSLGSGKKWQAIMKKDLDASDDDDDVASDGVCENDISFDQLTAQPPPSSRGRMRKVHSSLRGCVLNAKTTNFIYTPPSKLAVVDEPLPVSIRPITPSPKLGPDGLPIPRRPRGRPPKFPRLAIQAAKTDEDDEVSRRFVQLVAERSDEGIVVDDEETEILGAETKTSTFKALSQIEYQCKKESSYSLRKTRDSKLPPSTIVSTQDGAAACNGDDSTETVNELSAVDANEDVACLPTNNEQNTCDLQNVDILITIKKETLFTRASSTINDRSEDLDESIQQNTADSDNVAISNEPVIVKKESQCPIVSISDEVEVDENLKPQMWDDANNAPISDSLPLKEASQLSTNNVNDETNTHLERDLSPKCQDSTIEKVNGTQAEQIVEKQEIYNTISSQSNDGLHFQKSLQIKVVPFDLPGSTFTYNLSTGSVQEKPSKIVKTVKPVISRAARGTRRRLKTLLPRRRPVQSAIVDKIELASETTTNIPLQNDLDRSFVTSDDDVPLGKLFSSPQSIDASLLKESDSGDMKSLKDSVTNLSIDTAESLEENELVNKVQIDPILQKSSPSINKDSETAIFKRRTPIQRKKFISKPVIDTSSSDSSISPTDTEMKLIDMVVTPSKGNNLIDTTINDGDGKTCEDSGNLEPRADDLDDLPLSQRTINHNIVKPKRGTYISDELIDTSSSDSSITPRQRRAVTSKPVFDTSSSDSSTSPVTPRDTEIKLADLVVSLSNRNENLNDTTINDDDGNTCEDSGNNSRADDLEDLPLSQRKIIHNIVKPNTEDLEDVSLSESKKKKNIMKPSTVDLKDISLRQSKKKENNMKNSPEDLEDVPLRQSKKKENNMKNSPEDLEDVPLSKSKKKENNMKNSPEDLEDVPLSKSKKKENNMENIPEDLEDVPLSKSKKKENNMKNIPEDLEDVPLSKSKKKENNMKNIPEDLEDVPLSKSKKKKNIMKPSAVVLKDISLSQSKKKENNMKNSPEDLEDVLLSQSKKKTKNMKPSTVDLKDISLRQSKKKENNMKPDLDDVPLSISMKLSSTDSKDTPIRKRKINVDESLTTGYLLKNSYSENIISKKLEQTPKVLLTNSDEMIDSDSERISIRRRNLRYLKLTPKLAVEVREENNLPKLIADHDEEKKHSPVLANEEQRPVVDAEHEGKQPSVNMTPASGDTDPYCPGDLVWVRKDAGFWPAIVIPDTFIGFDHVLRNGDEVSVHVQAINDWSWRSWSTIDNLELFDGLSTKIAPTDDPTKWAQAVAKSEELLKMTPVQRLSLTRRRHPLDRDGRHDKVETDVGSTGIRVSRRYHSTPRPGLIAKYNPMRRSNQKRSSEKTPKAVTDVSTPTNSNNSLKRKRGDSKDNVLKQSESVEKVSTVKRRRKLSNSKPPDKEADSEMHVPVIPREGSVTPSVSSNSSTISDSNLSQIVRDVRNFLFKDVSNDKICCGCHKLFAGPLYQCSGVCNDSYHASCVTPPISGPVPTDWMCQSCKEEKNPCFVCKQSTGHRQMCLIDKCGKFYHSKCLKLFPQTKYNHGQRVNRGLQRAEDAEDEDLPREILFCSLHTCHTCSSDNPLDAVFTHKDKLVRCIKCPTSYHRADFCIPAGSEILTKNEMICPKHLEFKKLKAKPVNVNHCFLCPAEGDLTCCDSCPSAIHTTCLPCPPPEEGYHCEECESGRFPLYGEVVWAKYAKFRWWPAKVVYPHQIPLNLRSRPRVAGQYLVQFYGSLDYAWLHNRCVYCFKDGDEGALLRENKSRDLQFNRALREATDEFALRKQELSLYSLKSNSKPPAYTKIKKNKPMKGLKDGKDGDVGCCQCLATDVDPCGPSSNCYNRSIMIECNPSVCNAGVSCSNQRFQKCIYPPLKPFKCGDKGWGLRSTVDIDEGQFIIEYVGEVIDEAELQARSKLNKTHFYFLRLNSNLYIDAGPMGNLSRFMNNSCNPNCCTQKWAVDGRTRIGIFATTYIPKNTELTFNYEMKYSGVKAACTCGSTPCSGVIGELPKAIKDKKKK